MDDAGASLQAQMSAMGRGARDAAAALRLCDAATRTRAIAAMATAVRAAAADILAANARDVAAAQGNGLAAAMVDRLLLDAGRVEAIAHGAGDHRRHPRPAGRGDRPLDAGRMASTSPASARRSG